MRDPGEGATGGLWTKQRLERRLDGELDDRPAVHLKHLTKRGVRDLRLSVRRGEVFGFLGPRGAGKTTTIRTMLDLLRPENGQAFLLGLESRIRSADIRRELGYVPGEAPDHGRVTGRRLLEAVARVRGGVPAGRIDALARRLGVDLEQRMDRMPRADRQKVGLVQAFMHDPALLVLDEPTNGLDPLDRQEVLRMVLEARARGATVFFASHVVPEVEKVCDRVAILRDGRLLTPSSVPELVRRLRRSLIVTFARPPDPYAFDVVPGLLRAETNGARMRFVMEGPLDPLVKALAQQEVLDLTSDDADLDEAFLRGGP